MSSTRLEIEEEIKPLAELDYAYLAGFIDGDGCFSITKSGHWNHCVKVGGAYNSTVEDVIELAVRSGGTYHHLKSRNCWQVQWQGSKTRLIVEAIKPYLRIKRQQADIMLEYLSTIGPRGYYLQDGVAFRRQELRQMMHIANGRSGGNGYLLYKGAG